VWEAVFSSSSTGFRIRAAQGQAADHVVAKHGCARSAERWRKMGRRRAWLAVSLALPSALAATLFFTFFPADCRICGSPLIQVSRLPVCKTCLLALRPLQGSYCSVCGEALHLPAYATSRRLRTSFEPLAERRGAQLCQRTDPPFERAVAYGSYDGAIARLDSFAQVPAGSSRGGGFGTHAGRRDCQLWNRRCRLGLRSRWFPFRCTTQASPARI
jgi:hypothetical protein